MESIEQYDSIQINILIDILRGYLLYISSNSDSSFTSSDNKWLITVITHKHARGNNRVSDENRGNYLRWYLYNWYSIRSYIFVQKFIYATSFYGKIRSVFMWRFSKVIHGVASSDVLKEYLDISSPHFTRFIKFKRQKIIQDNRVCWKRDR